MKRPTPHARRRRRAHAAAALALTLLAPLIGTRAAAETYWLDGREVEVTLRPLRPSFILGEPVELVLEFINRSADDLELLLSGEGGPGWPDDFEVRVFGPGGKALPRPDPEERGRDTPYTNTYVRASHDNTVTPTTAMRLRLDSWAELDRPGLYTVKLRRGVRAGPYGGSYRLFPGTTRPAVEVAVETQVRVVRGGPERVGGLIDELGEKMLGCDQTAAVEAAMRLADIADERVVAHFRRALDKCRAPNIRTAAVRAFAKFATEPAFEGLRLASRDADEDLRTVTANLIGTSKHPKALGLLLSLRRDPYYGVRMMVLLNLEGMDTARARRLIWEMSNDEHPLVKEEALRFLQERATHPPRR
jgi:hypothetical protein